MRTKWPFFLLTSFFALMMCLDSALAMRQPVTPQVPKASQADTFSDSWPWPWGAECPFPWENIEGYWRVRDQNLDSYLDFHVLSETPSGAKIFEIRHFDGNHNLIALGHGQSPKGQRIVRAALVSVDPTTQRFKYWVVVRAYVEQNKLSCSRNRLVHLVTIVDNTCGEGETFVIDKQKDD